MKKISLHSLLFIACFALVTSCSKDVKAPQQKTTASSSSKTGSGSTTTTNQTTQSQPGCGSSCPHSCGSGNTSSGYGGAGH